MHRWSFPIHRFTNKCQIQNIWHVFTAHVFSYRRIVFLRMEFRLTNLSCCERKLQGHQAQKDTDLVFETEFVEKLSDELGVPLSELRSFSTRNRCSQLETFKQV